MPIADAEVKVAYGTQNEIDAVTSKDVNTIYFTTDTLRIYVGNSEYYSTMNAATKQYIDDAIGGITQIDYQVVQELPATGVKGTIYLIAHSHGTSDVYDEYMWINNQYEKIGNTDVDLSGYIPTVANATNKIPKFNANGTLSSSTYELNKTVPADAVFSDTKVTQNIAPVTGTFDLLMAKTSGNHSAETDNVNKSGSNLTFNVVNKQLTIDGNKALTEADLVVCTQDEYDAMQTKPGLLYFIKEEST